MGEKDKTGASIDPVKAEIIIPPTVEIITQHLKDKEGRLSFLDFGSGDFTTTRRVITQSEEILPKKYFQNIVTLDIDPRSIAGAIVNAERWLDERNFFLLECDPLLRGLTKIPDKEVSVMHSSNTIHQIESDSELLHILMRLGDKLESEGIFVVTDLHPEYLKWLNVNYPDKLTNVQTDEEGYVLYADYLFDSGGSKPVYGRSIQNILELALYSGLQISQKGDARDLYMSKKLIREKTRYSDMFHSQPKVPMFYTLVLRPCKGTTESLTGTVEQNIPSRSGIFSRPGRIKLSGGHCIKTDGLSGGWNIIKPGDFVCHKHGCIETKFGAHGYSSTVVITKEGDIWSMRSSRVID